MMYAVETCHLRAAVLDGTIGGRVELHLKNEVEIVLALYWGRDSLSLLVIQEGAIPVQV